MIPHERPFSRLGFGTGTLASLGRAASLAEVGRMLDTMEELGQYVIDTADSYGSGDCEKLLGKALAGRKADDFQVVTKAGYRLADFPVPGAVNQFAKKLIHRMGAPQRFKPGYLETSVAASLRRLRRERVDALLLHDPPVEVVASDAVCQTCTKIRQTGIARFVGVSSANAQVIEQAMRSGVFQVIQTPANLAVAGGFLSLWEACQNAGIQVMGNHIFSPACLAVAGLDHRTVFRASAALLPASATVLTGTRNPLHFRECHEWAQDPMDPSEAIQLVAKFTAPD